MMQSFFDSLAVADWPSGVLGVCLVGCLQILANTKEKYSK